MTPVKLLDSFFYILYQQSRWKWCEVLWSWEQNRDKCDFLVFCLTFYHQNYICQVVMVTQSKLNHYSNIAQKSFRLHDLPVTLYLSCLNLFLSHCHVGNKSLEWPVPSILLILHSHTIPRTQTPQPSYFQDIRLHKLTLPLRMVW